MSFKKISRIVWNIQVNLTLWSISTKTSAITKHMSFTFLENIVNFNIHVLFFIIY